LVRAKAVVSVAFVIAGIMFCCSAANPESTSFTELMRLGDRESDNRRWNQAIDFYTKATKVSPSNWSGHAKRAVLLVQMGRINEARDSIKLWVGMHPDAWAWYCHGMEMENDGKYKAALSDLDRSCKLVRYSGKPFLPANHFCVAQYCVC
jgi:tetratricopeptide (TPR) repeat protein